MQIRTASGSYYAFPFIQGDDKLRTYQEPIIRKDWLDELRLDVPTTIDEWTVLQAFKDKKGAGQGSARGSGKHSFNEHTRSNYFDLEVTKDGINYQYVISNVASQ